MQRRSFLGGLLAAVGFGKTLRDAKEAAFQAVQLPETMQPPTGAAEAVSRAVSAEGKPLSFWSALVPEDHDTRVFPYSPDRGFYYSWKPLKSHYPTVGEIDLRWDATLCKPSSDVGVLVRGIVLRCTTHYNELYYPLRHEITFDFREVVAPERVLDAFFQEAGDVCKQTTYELRLRCEADALRDSQLDVLRAWFGPAWLPDVPIVLQGVVLTSIESVGRAQDMKFWGRVQGMVCRLPQMPVFADNPWK